MRACIRSLQHAHKYTHVHMNAHIYTNTHTTRTNKQTKPHPASLTHTLKRTHTRRRTQTHTHAYIVKLARSRYGNIIKRQSYSSLSRLSLVNITHHKISIM